ncbi:MAG: HAD family phosphatase [Clostridia bacterium]
MLKDCLKEIKGAIFDLDGTLIDSLWVWGEINREFFKHRNIEVPDDYAKAISTFGFELSANYTIERFHLNEKPQELMDEWLELSQHYYKDVIKIKPYVKEFILKLKEYGVKISLATASEPALYQAVLKSNGIYDLFDVFTSVNEVSRGKGFPDVYDKAVEKLGGLKPCDCMVFEDLYLGVKGAKDGGYIACGVYDDDSKDDVDKIKGIADFYIVSYKDYI